MNDQYKARNSFIELLMSAGADEKKIPMFTGLIDEICDCKEEIEELKAKIKELKERGAKFQFISKRERLLLQKRANYTNMIGRLCKEVRKPDEKENPNDFLDDLEDYE